MSFLFFRTDGFVLSSSLGTYQVVFFVLLISGHKAYSTTLNMLCILLLLCIKPHHTIQLVVIFREQNAP